MYNAIFAASNLQNVPPPVKGNNAKKSDGDDFRNLVNDKINSSDSSKTPENKSDTTDVKNADNKQNEDIQKLQEQTAKDIAVAMLYNGNVDLFKVEGIRVFEDLKTFTSVGKQLSREEASVFLNKAQSDGLLNQKLVKAEDVVTEAVKPELVQVISKKVIEPEMKNVKANENPVSKEVLNKTGEEVIKPIETDQTQKSDIPKDLLQKEVVTAPKQQVKEKEQSIETSMPLIVEEKKPDVQKIEIKVGEGTNVKPKDLANEVAEKIVHRTTGKSDEFDIQLYPKDLGKLNIKVVFENGKAQLSIVCSNAKAYNLLSENIGSLCAIVKENTGSTATVEIQQNKEFFNEQQKEGYEDNSQNSHQQDSQHNSKRQNKDDMIDFIQQMRLGLV